MNKKHQVLKIIGEMMPMHQEGITNAAIVDALLNDYAHFLDDEDLQYWMRFSREKKIWVKNSYRQVIKKAWQDIESELQSENLSLNRIGKKNTIYRFPPGLSFNPCERILNRERRNIKQDIYEILKNSTDLLPSSWISKLGMLPEEDEAHWNKIVQFDTTSLQNNDLIPVMYDFIKAKKVVYFKYQPFGKKPFWVTFIPYLLKEYNLRWFVCGASMNKKTGAYQHSVFALDRILGSIKECADEYQENTLDYDHFFNDVVGMTVDPRKEVEDIVIKVINPMALDYIKTKKIHPSQQVQDDIVRFRLRTNYELETKLLEFGDRIIILQPDHLREDLRKRALTIAEMMERDKI